MICECDIRYNFFPKETNFQRLRSTKHACFGWLDNEAILTSGAINVVENF